MFRVWMYLFSFANKYCNIQYSVNEHFHNVLLCEFEKCDGEVCKGYLAKVIFERFNFLVFADRNAASWRSAISILAFVVIFHDFFSALHFHSVFLCPCIDDPRNMVHLRIWRATH